MNPQSSDLSQMVRWHSSWALAISLATVASGIATTFGLAPWIFLVAFGASGTYLLAPLLGWGRAAWATAVAALFASSWVLVIDPYIGVRLDVALTVVLCASVAVAMWIQWRRSIRTPYAVSGVRGIELVVALSPAAVSAAAFYGLSFVRGMPLSWAMRGDAQFNTVLARLVGSGNGETLNNVQVLSLAQGLMALVHQPGRATVESDQLLIHDVTRQANLWILMILLSSILAGTIAERVLRRATRTVRYFGIFASALIPLTWHMTGYAMDSGFYNVSLAFFVLELGFYFWITTGDSPLWGSAILLVITVIMLGAWTPMAIIPFAWATWAAWRGLRSKPPRCAVITWGGSVVQLIAFGGLFILPGFLAKSSILSQNGTILPLSVNLYISLIAAAVIVAVAVGALRKAPTADFGHESDRQFALGLVLLAISGGVGTAFLVFQNRKLPDPWIYYPIKFAWVSGEVLILLIVIGAALLLNEIANQRVRATAAGVALILLVVSVLQLNPPQQGYRAAAFPLLSVVKNPSPLDTTLPLLTSVSGKKVFFSRYLDTERDTFMNQWQFQITAHDEFTPIRGYAYRVVSTVFDVCDAATTWGGGVEVITSSAPWATTLNASCSSKMTAVVHAPID